MNQDLEERARIQQQARQVIEGKPIPQENLEIFKGSFRKYDCFKPLSILLEQDFNQSQDHNAAVELIAIFSVKIPDLNKVQGICSELILKNKINFNTFLLKFLHPAIGSNNHETEKLILEKVAPDFPPNEEEACLERVTTLCEKFLFNSDATLQAYERLHTRYPSNKKSLLFFKSLYTQIDDHTNAEPVLRALVEIADDKERPNASLELALFLLYQKDEVEESAQLLNLYADQLGDAILPHLYETNVRMKKWEACVGILKNVEQTIEEPSQKANIHYRIAERYIAMNRCDEALLHLDKARSLDSSFLDAMALEIELLLEKTDWSTVRDRLEETADNATSSELRSDLRLLIQRIAQL